MASKTSGKKKTTTQTQAKKKQAAKKTTTARKTTSAKKTSGSAKNTSGGNEFMMTEILIWVTLAASILMLISNFGLGGTMGRSLASVQQGVLGWMAYIFPVLLFTGVSFLISNKGNRVAYIKTAAGVVALILCCVLFELIDGQGGSVGKAVTGILVPAIGAVGTYVVVIIFMVICVVVITEKSILRGVKKGSAKAYDRAKEDMIRHKEEARERKARREEMRVDHQVSGVSFDTTLIKAEDTKAASENASAKDEKKVEKSTGKKATRRSKKDVSTVLEGADEAAAKHILEETGKISLDNVVINRAMPLSATELIPDPEPEVEKPVKEKLPGFLKGAMEEAGVTFESTRGTKIAEAQAEPGERGAVAEKSTAKGSSKVKADIPKEVEEVASTIAQNEKQVKEYRFPPLSLLKHGSKNSGDSDAHLRETATKLQKTLQTFGVNVTITNISCGPSVTRYELQPEMGVKVSKIVGLADDIKLNLAAADIRIEAPIPGKAAVGIEVPNKENTAVMLRDLLESEEFRKSKSRIAFATGRDISGKVVVSDIAKMPHLLVAGATGSGKSVCINTIIMSIIYKSRPEDVKLIMVDPKVVELSVYNGIPHLMIPVVTDPKKAAGALNWAVAEMNRRYQLFAEYNVRDLKGYNDKVENIKDIDDPDKAQKLPQIVIIVDELADLMMVAPGEVEEAICRLAQLARAAGLHLVLATQRPSVNVITGLIKANMPSRIAFSVSSGVDSRTIIDMNGAEKLLGKGDMLFYPAGYQKPVRVQGAFVSDKEVQAVVDFLKENNGSVSYSEEIQKQVNSNQSISAGNGSSSDDKDVYFVDAGKFIIEKDKASIGMLQRVFKIGFNRAARIMDQLAEAGVVGDEEGTKPRKVLMSMEQFEQYIEESV